MGNVCVYEYGMYGMYGGISQYALPPDESVRSMFICASVHLHGVHMYVNLHSTPYAFLPALRSYVSVRIVTSGCLCNCAYEPPPFQARLALSLSPVVCRVVSALLLFTFIL